MKRSCLFSLGWPPFQLWCHSKNGVPRWFTLTSFQPHLLFMVSSMVSTLLNFFHPPPSNLKFTPPAHWYETSWVPPSPIFLEHKSLFLDLLISFVKSFKTLNFSKHVSHVTAWDYGITLENILKYILFLETHVIALARAGTHGIKFVCAIYCTHKNIVFSLSFVITIYFK